MGKTKKILLYCFLSINVLFLLILFYFCFKSSFEKTYKYKYEEIYFDNDCFVFEEELFVIKRISSNRLMRISDEKELNVNAVFKNYYHPNEILNYQINDDYFLLLTTYGIIKLDSNLNILADYKIGYYNSIDDYYTVGSYIVVNDLIYSSIESNNSQKLLIIDLNFNIIKEEIMNDNILKEYNLYLTKDNTLSKESLFDLSIVNGELLINDIRFNEIKLTGNKVFDKILSSDNKIIFSTFLQEQDSLSSIYEGIHNFSNFQLWEYDKIENSISCLEELKKGAMLIDFDNVSYQYYYNGGLYSNDTLMSECKKLQPAIIQYESIFDVDLNYRIVFYVAYSNDKFYYSYDYDVSVYDI